jgi:hypothetical protein
MYTTCAGANPPDDDDEEDDRPPPPPPLLLLLLLRLLGDRDLDRDRDRDRDPWLWRWSSLLCSAAAVPLRRGGLLSAMLRSVCGCVGGSFVVSVFCMFCVFCVCVMALSLSPILQFPMTRPFSARTAACAAAGVSYWMNPNDLRTNTSTTRPCRPKIPRSSASLVFSLARLPTKIRLSFFNIAISRALSVIPTFLKRYNQSTAFPVLCCAVLCLFLFLSFPL